MHKMVACLFFIFNLVGCASNVERDLQDVWSQVVSPIVSDMESIVSLVAFHQKHNRWPNDLNEYFKYLEQPSLTQPQQEVVVRLKTQIVRMTADSNNAIQVFFVKEDKELKIKTSSNNANEYLVHLVSKVEEPFIPMNIILNQSLKNPTTIRWVKKEEFE